jgi:dihydrofolate reductase
MPTIAIIVAMDRAGLIGCATGLPWRLPADLKRFKKLTWGKPIIMGRKTHEQIGRVLPGRTNIVLTRDADYNSPGPTIVTSVRAALEAAAVCLQRDGGDEIMVVGGSEVYREFLTHCTRIYLTLVEGEFQGNAWFPGGVPGSPEWAATQSEFLPIDEANPHAHRFAVLERSVLAMSRGQPPLRPLHADSTLIKSKLDKCGRHSDQELIDSLMPGQPGSLKARPDGTMVDGHHRIKILRDRGVDVDSLPREIIEKDEIPPSP